MASFNQFCRLFIIAEKLHARRKSGISKIEIVKHIKEITGDERPISDRTFSRDMQSLRSLPFYLEIHCENNVYKLVESSWDGLDYRQLIEPFQVFSALHANAELSDVIFPERYGDKGTAHLNPLLNAIRNNRKVKIIYAKHGEKSLERDVEPYAIKQVKGIWYLLGKDMGLSQLRSFGLDRITKLIVTPVKFRKDPSIDVKEKFRYSYGIYSSEEYAIEDVVLSFDRSDGYYLKSMPLHDSQEILEDSEESFKIKLRLRITEDFVMALMSRSWSVRVEEPKHLRNRLKSIYQAALDRLQ